jgi:hypothetical protein
LRPASCRGTLLYFRKLFAKVFPCVIHTTPVLLVGSTFVIIFRVVPVCQGMFASELKKCVWAFQVSAPISGMAGPLKANSDASDSDSGLEAANNVLGLTRFVPHLEEDGQNNGTSNQLGCTTVSVVAKASDARQTSAVRYDAICTMKRSY